MGTTTHPTASVRDALCNHIVDQLDGGTIELQLTAGGTEVATLTFDTPAFDAAGSAGGNSTGVATAEAITSDTNATGNASPITYAQLKASDTTVILQCDVSTIAAGTGAIQLSSTTIGASDTVSMSSLTYEAAP
jgi:hypothetical protein